jgi:hypothetical protein
MANFHSFKMQLSNKIILLATIIYVGSGCNNSDFVSYDFEIKESSILNIINDVQKEVGENAILKLTVRSSNHTPFDTGYNWFIAYVEPVYFNSAKTNLIENPPMQFAYVSGTLVLLYTDIEFAIAPSSKFISSLTHAIDNEKLFVENDSIPLNFNQIIYRYEYCNGEIKSRKSNIFRPDIIPECSSPAGPGL